jgi:hypothetical protein
VVGVGDARVQVPRGTCVTTDALIGFGAADLPSGDEHGFDVAVANAAPPREGRRQVHVDADLGMGYLQIPDNGSLACA